MVVDSTPSCSTCRPATTSDPPSIAGRLGQSSLAWRNASALDQASAAASALWVPRGFSSLAKAWPVPGASVYAFSLNERNPMLYPVACSYEGEFRARLSPDAQEAGVVVAAPGFALHAARTPVGAPVTVPLRQDGGRLILDFDKPPTMGPLIVHGDVPIYWGIALSWTAKHGGFFENDRAVIADVEPGSYVVCMPTSRVPALALWSGQRPADHCAGGVVPSGGDLRLTLPVD